MPNPPVYLGKVSPTGQALFNWGRDTQPISNGTFAVKAPVGSLILLAAKVEYSFGPPQPAPPSFVNTPAPGTWFTIFNYLTSAGGLYIRVVFMYKFADSNDASSSGQTYTIAAGDARYINPANSRSSGGAFVGWNNVHPTTPVVLTNGPYYLPTGQQATPPISSAVPSVAFGYWPLQITINSIGEDNATPPSASGWSSDTSFPHLMVFYWHTTPGDTFYPGVTWTVSPSGYYPGWGHSFVIVPAGDPPYPASSPTPSLTRSRAVPLAIAGPRLNEVTAAYKPVIRVY